MYVTLMVVHSNQWRIQEKGREGPPPLFLDQTEARRAEKKFFGDRPPPPPPILMSGSATANDKTNSIESGTGTPT